MSSSNSSHTEVPHSLPTASSTHISSEALAGVLALMLIVSTSIAIYWYKKCKQYQRTYDLMNQINRLELMWRRSPSK